MATVAMHELRRYSVSKRRGLVVLIFLLALFGAGIYSLASLSRASDWVKNTDEARIVLSRCLSTLVDAETGLRGYLVTGDRTFLEPYEKAPVRWQDDLQALRRLAAGSPEQHEYLDRLARLALARFALLAKGRAQHDARVADPELAATVRAGKQTMDDIRTVIADMASEQQRHNNARQAAAISRWRWTMALYLGGGFLFLLVVATAWLQRRDADARRHRAEEAARANDLFRSLVDNLTEMAWTAGPDGRVDFRNRRWVEYTGLSLEEIERSGREKLHHPGLLPEMLERWEAGLATGEPFEMEFPLRGADGAFRWFMMRVRPLRDRAGRILRWFGTNTDVTRYTELVDEIAAERAKLHSLIMHLPVAVGLFEGVDLTLRAANPAFERLIPAGAVAPGTPSGDVLRKLHGTPFVEALAECQRTGEAQSVAEHPATIAGLDGGRAARVFTTSFAPLRDHAGRVTGVVSAGIDLTDQAEARSSLEASIRFAEEFVGIVSHDLRNPLMAISVAARRLKAHAPPDSADHRTIGMVASGAARMTRMVEQLMDLSHARLTGAIPIDKTIVDVATVLQPVVEELRLAHLEQEIRWENGTPGLCLCDGDRIAQVASNLISNAVVHGGRAGPIRVSLTGTDDSLALTVHNNGPPIASEMLPAIFDPSIRRKESKGLGLGLYIAQQIVKAHDGRIEVTSNVQGGTVFRVLLPRRIATPADGLSDAPAHA